MFQWPPPAPPSYSSLTQLSQLTYLNMSRAKDEGFRTIYPAPSACFGHHSPAMPGAASQRLREAATGGTKEGKAGEAARVAEVGITADVLGGRSQQSAAAGGRQGSAAQSPAPGPCPAWKQSAGLAAFGDPSFGVPVFGAPALQNGYAPFSTGAMAVSTLQPWMAPASAARAAMDAPNFLAVPAAAANPWAAAAAKASAPSDAWGAKFQKPAGGGTSSVLTDFQQRQRLCKCQAQQQQYQHPSPQGYLAHLQS